MLYKIMSEINLKIDREERVNETIFFFIVSDSSFLVVFILERTWPVGSRCEMTCFNFVTWQGPLWDVWEQLYFIKS